MVVDLRTAVFDKLTQLSLSFYETVRTGEVLWQEPLGTLRDAAPLPVAIRIGMPTMGGPIVTGGDIVFIGATMDDYLRAFDIDMQTD